MIIDYDSFAILTQQGMVVYSSPPFNDLLDADGSSIIGTCIDSWIKPVNAGGVMPWHGDGNVLDGVLWFDRRAIRLRYRVEPLASAPAMAGKVLFLWEDDNPSEDSLEDIYPRAFQLNPGLSAISSLDTGLHLDVNKAWLRTMGYDRSEVIGKTSSELNVWQNDKMRAEIIRRLTRDGYVENFEAVIRRKDGKLLDILVSAELVEHHGQQLCFFASHDVTALKRSDKLRNSWQKKAHKLSRIAMIDGLTGIANRRYFDEMIIKEWKRCGRQKKFLAVLLMDIDLFKRYNDHYGHPAGDECLRSIALAMKAQIHRSGDLLCRYGGEEFCCILPDTNDQGAWHIANLIQKAVGKLAIAHEKSSVSSHVTLSIGIASMIPDGDHDVEYLINIADMNLYKAKANGRARIEG